jgi:hypothetical protein
MVFPLPRRDPSAGSITAFDVALQECTGWLTCPEAMGGGATEARLDTPIPPFDDKIRTKVTRGPGELPAGAWDLRHGRVPTRVMCAMTFVRDLCRIDDSGAS